MKKVKEIQNLVEVIAGYSAVVNSICTVLSETEKGNEAIKTFHLAIMTEVYNYFVKELDIYKKYIICTAAHEAHHSALIDIKQVSKQAVDVRARLTCASEIIQKQIKEYKKEVIELISSL